MGGFAMHALACAVSQAGGLGIIGSVNDMPALDNELSLAQKALGSSNLRTAQSGTLPIGVGFILFIADLDAAAQVVAKYKPAVVWFFAAKANADYTTGTKRMREASPASRIWIQTGSVAAAISIAQACKPDVLVAQGIDAGGHGYEAGAGIVSLVPEMISALATAGLGSIPVVTSGGIADGRGIAAALALGAQGAVMGTRFLAAKECVVPAPGYRDAVLKANDGGQATVRHKVFDELRGPNMWPVEYDGRSIAVDSYVDFKGGMGIDEVRRLHQEAAGGADQGFSEEKGKARAAIWAGTGVGLVNRTQSAAEIVHEIRGGALDAFEKARSQL